MQPYDDILIHGTRVDLSALTSADAPALLQMNSDPEVMKYGATSPWVSLAQAEAKVRQHREEYAANAALELGIRLQGEASLIGTCSLFGIANGGHRAEIGYALSPRFWKQGYALEAMTAFIDAVFARYPLHRLEADIDPANAASAKLLDRLGFAPEGLLRERWKVDGVITDSRLYGLLRRDWEKRLSPRASQG